MSTKVALNRQRLKHRIEDFFDSCEERKEARALVEALAAQTRAWIFGGMIRDIGLFGRKGFTSDIDIVIDGNHDVLHRLLSHFHIEQVAVNKLGGVRFSYRGIDFDIWSLQETWAFKNNIIEFEEPDSLLKTTLMSWDSVLYDVRRKTVITTEYYLNDLHQKRLELVLPTNPNQAASVVRILRTIYNKHVEILGPNLCLFLSHVLHDYSYEILQEQEYRSYRSVSFSEGKLDKLIENLHHAKPGCDLKLSFS